MLHLRCPHCRRSVWVRRVHAGHPLACSHCSKLFIVPDPAATTLRAPHRQKPTELDVPAVPGSAERASTQVMVAAPERPRSSEPDDPTLAANWLPASGTALTVLTMFLGFLGLVVSLTRTGRGLGLAITSAILSLIAFLLLIVVASDE